jgi:hypothetical protein
VLKVKEGIKNNSRYNGEDIKYKALQQRIQPKRDISDAASWTGYGKYRYIVFEK